MSYTLDLPPDTRQQISDFIENLQGNQRKATINTVLDELNKISVNPKLGTTVYGGPLERRRIHRFLLAIGSETIELQFAYIIFESTQTVVVSGFDRAPMT